MSVSTHSNSELIAAYLDAVMRKDASVVDRFFAPDVEYMVNGTSAPDPAGVLPPISADCHNALPWLGLHRGREGVKEFLAHSLPALMQLLGHKDIRMTLRYVQVTQQDLQREFRLARQNAVQLHHIPQLPLPQTTVPVRADPSAIRDAISATRYLLELFRLQIEDDNARRKLRRLTKRLFNIGRELDHLTPK